MIFIKLNTKVILKNNIIYSKILAKSIYTNLINKYNVSINKKFVRDYIWKGKIGLYKQNKIRKDKIKLDRIK